MKIDRKLQREILVYLKGRYPRESGAVTMDARLGTPEDIQGNLYYLREHRLVELAASTTISGKMEIHHATITARGIDFLEDDGGVSAILDTVTIKLHEETLRQLIEAKLQASDLPEEQKSGILKALREAPGETTKQLIAKLVDLGMENAPKAIPLIQTLLRNSGS